jgi:hypothetical protein
MLPPRGKYRYEISRGGAAIATEEAHFGRGVVVVLRRAVEGQTIHKIEAKLDAEDRVSRVSMVYSSPPFKRDASYRTDNEVFRGSVSTIAGRNEIVIKLGRFAEVEVGGMTAFRMLILAHVRERGQARWTGRVAVIDPSTLTAASLKQTCRLSNSNRLWIYEARMGDTEEIELDADGRIIASRTQDRAGSRLLSFEAIEL